MKVFRAMSEEEFIRTMKKKSPDFSKKRFKYFSPSLSFIQERVRDGKFNNSSFIPERYIRCVAFEISAEELLRCNKVSDCEIVVDRRKNISLKVISEI